MPVLANIPLSSVAPRVEPPDFAKTFTTLAQIKNMNANTARLSGEEARAQALVAQRAGAANYLTTTRAAGAGSTLASLGRTQASAEPSYTESELAALPQGGSTPPVAPAPRQPTPPAPARSRDIGDADVQQELYARFPEAAHKFISDTMDTKTRKLQLDLAEQEFRSQAFEHLTRTVGLVTDQKTYDAYKTAASSFLTKEQLANFPDTFSPEFVPKIQGAATSVAAQVAQLLEQGKMRVQESQAATQAFNARTGRMAELRAGTEVAIDPETATTYRRFGGDQGGSTQGADSSDVAAADTQRTGMPRAVRQAQGTAAAEHLKKIDAAAEGATALTRQIDEADLVVNSKEGIYERGPLSAVAMKAYTAGLSTDQKAANTVQLRQIGAALTLAAAPNGSLGSSVSEGDRKTLERAGGDLEKAQNVGDVKAALSRARRAIASIHEHANAQRESYSRTGGFPPYGSPRATASGANPATQTDSALRGMTPEQRTARKKAIQQELER